VLAVDASPFTKAKGPPAMITHPEKVLFPEDASRKQPRDVIRSEYAGDAARSNEPQRALRLTRERIGAKSSASDSSFTRCGGRFESWSGDCGPRRPDTVAVDEPPFARRGRAGGRTRAPKAPSIKMMPSVLSLRSEMEPHEATVHSPPLQGAPLSPANRARLSTFCLPPRPQVLRAEPFDVDFLSASN